MKLEKQIAIVTGSDSGIGHATAVAFAREGADVAVTIHKDVEGSKRTAVEVEKAGRRTVLVNLEQTDPASVAAMFEEVSRTLGTPTILVNCAGIDSTGKRVSDMPVEDWDNEIRTNLHGPFYCCQQFIRRIKGTGKRGVIINVTSVHQELPRAGASGYCAAKAGLRNLTRCLALELAEKNISVKNIAPGMVLTPFNQPAIDDPQVLKEQTSSIPQKRAATAEEIARAILVMATPEADYLHGTTVYLDGGLMQNVGQGA